jgi:hypothetical protein
MHAAHIVILERTDEPRRCRNIVAPAGRNGECEQGTHARIWIEASADCNFDAAIARWAITRDMPVHNRYYLLDYFDTPDGAGTTLQAQFSIAYQRSRGGRGAAAAVYITSRS